MENASKALVIAANVLLAVIILSLVMYFYNTWRVLPLEEESARLVEQAQEFNKQYEVFDKKIMYGVDVLSAVNKAISNNEKYVAGKWLSGALSGNEFAIEVEVVLATPLEEQVDVYYYETITTSAWDEYSNTISYTSTSKENQDFGGRTDEGYANLSGVNFSNLNSEYSNIKPKLKLPSDFYIANMYEDIDSWSDISIDTQTLKMKTGISSYEYTSDSGNYVYTLLNNEFNKESIEEGGEFLKTLIETINTFTTTDSQVIYNRDESTLNEWSKIEWVPAVSEFKNRKFRCEGIDEDGNPNGTPGIQYSEKTGAINKLTFVEYTIPTVE